MRLSPTINPTYWTEWYQDTEQEGESQGESSRAAKTEWGFQGVQGAKILRVYYWRRQNCREKQRVENGVPDINRRCWVVSIRVCEETTQHGLKQRKRGTYPWGSTGLRIMWIHISSAEKLRIYGTLGKKTQKETTSVVNYLTQGCSENSSISQNCLSKVGHYWATKG